MLRIVTIILAIILATLCVAVARAQDAAAIQAALDTTSFCQLAPRTYRIETPLRIGSNMRLTGCGKASVLLAVAGCGPYAIEFGSPAGSISGAYLDNFAVSGAGIWFRQVAQHCGADRIWVNAAPQHGFYFAGFGEKFVLRDCVAWAGLGDGFHVRADNAAFNGLLFEHCNAQGNRGAGVRLAAIPPLGEINKTVLRDCTVQSNGVRVFGMPTGADVHITGYVLDTWLDSIWVESTNAQTGLLSEPATVGTTAWRPGSVCIVGASHFAPFTGSPMVFRDLRKAARIERCAIEPAAPIQYRARLPIVLGTEFVTPVLLIVELPQSAAAPIRL